MDVASGIAGLIGLAALAAQSTLKIIDLIKDIKDLPNKFRRHLAWLEQLIQVLKEIPKIFAAAEHSGAVIDLSILQSCLQDCSDTVKCLAEYLEIRVRSLEATKGLEKRIYRLKGVFASKHVEEQMKEIQIKQGNLKLCSASVMPQLQIQDHHHVLEMFTQAQNEVSNINRGIEDQATTIKGIEQLQLQNHDDVFELGVLNQSAVSEISRSVECQATRLEKIEQRITDLASFAASILSTNQASEIDLMHTMMKLQLELREMKQNQDWQSNVQSILPMETAAWHQTVPGNPASRNHTVQLNNDSLHQCQPSAKCPRLGTKIQQFLPHNREEDLIIPKKTTYLGPSTDQKPILTSHSRTTREKVSKREKKVYAQRLQNFLGYIDIRAYQNYEEVTEGKVRDFIDVRIYIFVFPVFCRRSIQVTITYDRVHGLSSPMPMQLQFSITRPYYSDPIVKLMKYGSFSDFKSLFQSKDYRPNDLFVGRSPNYFPRSILRIAIRFGRIPIVRFLLDQGARVDTRTYSSFLFRSSISRRGQSGFNVDLGRDLLHASYELDPVCLGLWLGGFQSIGIYEENALLLCHEKSSLDASEISYSWPVAMAKSISQIKLKGDAHFHAMLKECERISARLKFNYQTYDYAGQNSLHIAIWQFMHNSTLKPGYKVLYLKFLLEHGVDPCRLDNWGHSPTMDAVTYSITSEWIGALEEAHISVEAVILHTLSSISDSLVTRFENYTTHFAKGFHSICQNAFSKNRFNKVSAMRQYLLSIFAEHGYHIHFDESVDPNVYELSATGAEYMPSTIYDPTRPKTEMRKRKPTTPSQEPSGNATISEMRGFPSIPTLEARSKRAQASWGCQDGRNIYHSNHN